MTIGREPDCTICTWYHAENEGGFTCDAFPEDIPQAIMMGKKHTEVWVGQEGEFVYQKFDRDRDMLPPEKDGESTV
jgi:hypothetical protein